MNTESPRTRAMLAGCAALVVFGITIPATATPGDHGNRPGVGTVGKAGDNAHPPGQEVGLDPNLDSNKGFRCDGNKGAGAGNPAHDVCSTGDGEGYTAPTPGEDSGSTPGNPDKGDKPSDKPDKAPGTGSGSTTDPGYDYNGNT